MKPSVSDRAGLGVGEAYAALCHSMNLPHLDTFVCPRHCGGTDSPVCKLPGELSFVRDVELVLFPSNLHHTGVVGRDGDFHSERVRHGLSQGVAIGDGVGI